MNKQTEAMKMALEALRKCRYRALADTIVDPAIDALQKALAEQPVLQNIEQYRLQMAAICTAAIGYWREGDGIHPDYDTVALRDVARLHAKYERAMAAAQPAQRTWVGLKEEDMGFLFPHGSSVWVQDMVKIIEAKLKEKNT